MAGSGLTRCASISIDKSPADQRRDRRGKRGADEFRHGHASTARGLLQRDAHAGSDADLRLFAENERLAAIHHHDDDDGAGENRSLYDAIRLEATQLRI